MRHNPATAIVAVSFALLFPAVARGAHTLGFTVIDAGSQQPIAEVTLSLSGACGSEPAKGVFTTDAAGKADLVLPSAEARYLTVSIARRGYVPMLVTWPARGESGPGTQLVPTAYTLALEPATTIGGRVLDDASQPIEGATVVLHVRNKPDPARPNQTVNVIYETAKTDSTGTWSYTGVPAAFDTISLGAYHTAYNSTGGGGFYMLNEFSAVGKLRDGSAVLAIPRGVPIEGVVLDADGQPLQDARVGMGQDRVAGNSFPEAVTDQNGRFRLAAAARAAVVLTAMAAGYAPDLQRIVLSQAKATVEFRLEPAKTLRGRVVDTAGQPLPGARLFVDTWRGCRTLNASLSTDVEGRFAWHDAPADEVLVDVLLLGYAEVRGMPVTASDQEITITLRQPLRVTGTVVDAETGLPVDTFVVVPGAVTEGGGVTWDRPRGRTTGHGGSFTYEWGGPRPGYAVRIEAEGYVPADSRTVKREEASVTLEFRLAKGKGLSGIVRDHDGNAVAGAKVVLATTETGAYLRNGTELADRGAATAQTDEAGRYSFPPQTGPFIAVAFAAAGYAEVPAEQLSPQPDITLTPWGRLEGTVRVSGKPGAGARISVYEDRPYGEATPSVTNELHTSADTDGAFAFDRVRPGGVRVVRTHMVDQGGGIWQGGVTHQARVTVKPGETATVTLGGSGRPVVGRVAIPADVLATPQWLFSTCELASRVHWPRLNVPAGVEPEQQREWYAGFRMTEAGRKYGAELEEARQGYREFTLVMQDDGSFRADDVEPGTYELKIAITEPHDGAVSKGLASVTRTITIDPIPDGHSDEPLDLGTLAMLLRK